MTARGQDSLGFPFSAVVGMDDLALALCLSAVSPSIGGVLVRGEKGTAKSTMVRALAAVLPPVAVVPGCRFACDPAAPDPACPDGPHDARGQGGVLSDRSGWSSCRSGRARTASSARCTWTGCSPRGRCRSTPACWRRRTAACCMSTRSTCCPTTWSTPLLDSAAMGRARVEREGVSITHAARFVLVGTMNPEEGELRPQLLDRFGLTVDVAASREPLTRVEVMRRRLAFERDPQAFVAAYADAESALATRIAAAEAKVAAVELPRRGGPADSRDLRGLRGRRAARRPRDRSDGDGARRLVRAQRGHRRGRAGRRPARAAAPPSAQPVRPVRRGRRPARGDPRRARAIGPEPDPEPETRRSQTKGPTTMGPTTTGREGGPPTAPSRRRQSDQERGRARRAATPSKAPEAAGRPYAARAADARPSPVGGWPAAVRAR